MRRSTYPNAVERKRNRAKEHDTALQSPRATVAATVVMVAAAAMVLVAACAEPNSVTGPDGISQLGPDTYLHSDTFRHGEMADARNRAITHAGLYCDRQGRRLLVQEVEPGPTNGHGAGSVHVTFRCLYPADPELQRQK